MQLSSWLSNLYRRLTAFTGRQRLGIRRPRVQPTAASAVVGALGRFFSTAHHSNAVRQRVSLTKHVEFLEARSLLSATTTTVSASSASPVYGTSEVFTATITDSGNSVGAGGTVTFYNGASALGTSAVDSNGQATFSSSSLSAGTYQVSAIYSGYLLEDGSSSDVSNVTVTPATPTISVTTYDSTYNGASYVATGSATGIDAVNLTSDLTLSGTSHTNAGTYSSDAWTFHDPSGNYSDESGTVTDVIEKANATFVVTPFSASYDGNSHSATGIAVGVASENLSNLLSFTSESDAGSYNDTWTFAGNGNYLSSSGTVSDNISPAALTVTASSQSKVYGASDPTLTFSANGFKSTDTESSVLSGALARISGEDVGVYTINQGTLVANSNYTISYTSNNLTITKATLNVSADSQTKVYGSSDPTLTFDTTGLQLSDSVSSVLSGALTRAAGENVFSYAISEGSLTANGNYSINFTGNNLTITQATLLVSAEPMSKVYGASDPTLTYVATGFQFADTSHNVIGGALSRATGEDVGSYAISQGSLTANGNYSLSFTGDNLTITQATLTVTANALTKVYGASDPTLSYVTSGLQFSDSISTVLSGSLTRATGEDVGSYAIGEGSLAATGNYTINFTGNNLAITQATLYVSADAQTKVYGTTDPTLTYVTLGLQYSDNAASVLTGALTRAAGENVGSYAISLGSLAANSDYLISFTGNNLAITKAVLTVAADSQTKIYGATDPTLTYVTTGLQFSDSAGSVLTGHLTRAAGENVFSYAITEGSLATNGNYSLNFTGNSLTITPATLTVTANAPSKVYGASDPTLTYVATGLQFADTSFNVLTGALARATGENVGTYAISQGTLTANGNYTLSFTGNNLTIAQATLIVSANALTKVYGATDPTLTYVTTGLQFSDTAGSVFTGALTRATGEDVGSYAVSQGTLAANGNYTVTFNGNNLTITKAVLTVSADTATKVYGATDPTLTYVTSGFQFSDNAAGVLTGALTRATGENVGSYAISLGTLAANSDYSISFTGNNLTITKAVLTVAADAQTKVYGATDPTLTYVTTGLQFSDSASGVLTGHLTRAVGENVFSYAITEGTLATNGNYSLSFTGNNLTITKATLTVTANALAKDYGSTDSALTYVTTGFEFADTSVNVLTGALARATGENVGTYAINQGTLTSNGNYLITFTGNDLTITQATLTVSANALTKVYGATDPTLTYVTTGLQFSDTAASVLTGALSRATGEDVGSYAVSQGTLAANGNYTVTFNGNNLTITKAVLTVSADVQTKVYGATDPTLTYVTTGFQFSDNAAGVLTGALARATGENVGSYAISLGTLAANSDYSISFTGNNLTITKAVLTVAADAQTKVYGATDPTLTYVTTGLQFSDSAGSVLTGHLTRAAGENVFSYAITEGNLATNGNYTLSFTGNSLTITPATLTVTTNAQTKVYGATDPTLNYVATGYQFADTGVNVLTGALARAAGENVGTYAIAQGTLTSNGNYTLSFTGNNLTITQATLTVSANSLTKVYGASDPTLTYVTTGLQFADTASSVFTGALSRATGEDVGSYAVSQGTLAANGNYTVTFNGNNLTITKAVLTVSADTETKVYGATDPTLTYVTTGFQFSDNAAGVLTGALARATGEDVGSYAISLGTLAANSDYSISFTGNNLTITKAVLTVAADAQTKVYGTVDPTLTYVTTGLQFSDSASGVLTGHLTRAAGENVFSYAITEGNLATNGNYTLSFTGNSLTITPATLTLTANAQTKVYGATDPTLNYVVSGYQFADTNLNVLSGTLARAVGENVGTYAIAQGTLTANGNYSLSFTGNNLTIIQAALTVSANALTKVYGATDPTLTYVTTGLQFSDTAGSVLTGALTRATGEDVGSYAISQGTLAANGNYTVTFNGNNLTITKAVLTVAADVQTKVYGATDPTLTYVTTGFQFSDDAASVFTGALARATGENVGRHAISLGTLAANSDYTIIFTGNNLTITKAVLTVAADSQTKVYGTTDPTLTYVTTGLQFSDSVSSVLTGHLTRTAGENVFSYAITEGTLATNGNYTLSFTGNTLTITQAALTVSANAKTKVYGATDPALTYVVTGFQFSDNAASVLMGALARTSGEDVGSYSINQGTLVANGNYSISYTGNNLTVTPATLTVLANVQSKIYGATDPTLTYVTTGFQFSDNANSVLTGLLTRAAGEDVGTYAISQGTLAANSDYTISFTGNQLTITKATMTVTADALTKVYGSTDPTLTYVVTGLAFSDDAASLLTGSLTRSAGENVGTYVISQGTLAAIGNYSLTFVSNNLTITQATLNVSANAQTKILNTADPALTYVVTGLQFSDHASSVLSGALTRVAGEDVGDYAINQGTLAANNNYAINFASNNLTIWNPSRQVVFQSCPSTGTAGTKLTPALKVAVLDANGNVVTTDNSSVTIQVTTGPGDFTSDSTLTVTAVHGIATFNNLELNTSGTYTLTVSDGALTSATSSSITISPAAASQVILQQVPSTGTAGVALSPGVIVDVQDKFGNFIQAPTVVTLTMSGKFSTGLASVSATTVAGVATFSSLIVNKAGTYSLRASIGAISSSYFNVNVSPAAANRLAFIQPPTSSMSAGVALNPAIVVSVQDQFGNIVTTDNSSVTLTLSTGTFSNNSATVSVTAQNGVAEFDNLIINKIGTYKLTASNSASLTTAATQNFAVVPGVITSLSIQQKPTTGTAGIALSPAVQVTVLDQFGNTITSVSSVTLTLTSGTFSTKSGTVTASTNAGIATFSNLIFNAVGTYTLTASVGSVTGPSFNVTISPAVASKVVFQQAPPTSGTAGVALSPNVVVAVQDSFGNRITTDSSTVTLTLAGGTFADGTTTVTAQAVNGIATFSSLIINKAGTNYTLSASDGTLAKVTSVKLAIIPASSSQLAFQTIPAKGTAGVAIAPAIKVSVLDAFGNIVTSDTSSVTLTLSTGTFSSGSSTVTVATVNGIAVFDSLVINKTGTYKLTASDGDSITSVTSPNIVISPNAIYSLVIQQNPTTGTAGVALGTAVQVQVLDQFGNLVTNSSTVKLTLSSGTFSTRTSTATLATSTGIATFNNLIFNVAGTYTVTASVNAVTSSSFNVTVSPAAASKLVYSQFPPTTATAGVALSPAIVVSVEDQFGNIVTSDSSTVTLTLSAGTFSTGSSTVTATAVSGVATFNNLTINKSGTYKLTASDSASLTTVASQNIVVSPAAANSIAIQQNPTTGIAGTNLGPAIKVAVLDAFGNVVTKDASTITLTLSSGTFSTGSATAALTASSGVATFSSLNITVAGTYTLTVSDGSMTAQTFNVTINPAAASKLVFQQAPPTSGTAGVALSPNVVVAVEDRYGNLIVTDNSTVTLTLANGTFANGATTVTAQVVNGIATFSSLTIGRAGTNYTLTASDGSLTKISSAKIVITGA